MKKKLTTKEKRAAGNSDAKTVVKKKKKGSAFRTIVIIVLLLAAGGSVFYFGLVRVDLKPDQTAVFYSKTGGFSDKLIRPGDFVWKWEKLLPTNTSIFIFSLSPYRIDIDRKSVLPSGEVYASYLEGSADFSFTLKMSINIEIKPEALPGLCASDKLHPEGMEQWYSDISALVSESAVAFIQEYGRTYSGIKTISMNFQKMSEDLSDSLEQDYPSVVIKQIIPETINFPDLALYQAAREAYLALVEIKKDVSAESIKTSKAGEIESETRLAILSKYGEVFKKYPELLQFFNISPETAAKWLPEPTDNPAENTEN